MSDQPVVTDQPIHKLEALREAQASAYWKAAETAVCETSQIVQIGLRFAEVVGAGATLAVAEECFRRALNARNSGDVGLLRDEVLGITIEEGAGLSPGHGGLGLGLSL